MPRAKKTTKKETVKSGKYDPQAIESKWQDFWQEKKIFEVKEEKGKEKKYILIEFPYPSAAGLHMGHLRPYVAGDLYSRYLRHKGYNVLYSIGWDAFGLPAENYAIKQGIHPRITTEKNIANAKKQIKSWGLGFDWSREINTTDPNYYKWTQWIFLQFLKHGLAYEDEAFINWCPSCKTGLANEEVINGRCERCGTEVERKKLRQWMLKITAYADKLLEGLKNLDWPEPIKKLQEDWIGKKHGTKVLFEVRGAAEEIEIFTTRVDTIFGASFMVLAPEHPGLDAIVTPAQAEAVKIYVEQAIGKGDVDREVEAGNTKTGVFTGAYAINPLTQEEIPIWVSDYVLGSVGTGAIMAVPAHDERDHDFAKAHNLPIHTVVVPEGKKEEEVELPFDGEGVLVNSGSFSSLHSEQARKTITDYLERRGEGELAITYKLRDWVFSRQRYWGEPIPVVHCEKCGVVPVPEEDLPVLLPEVEKYEPTGTGESPLAAIEEWVNTKCPKCEGQAKRETNTMPQWAGSSWYWLRYADPKNDKELAGKEKLSYWQPVDEYFGGMEHTTLHLLYSRFWNQFLYDHGLVTESEPYKHRRPHGIVLGPDGEKMSKSRGNVVNPDDIMAKYGSDTLRMYELFLGPHEAMVAWNEQGIVGVNRFLERIWNINTKLQASRWTSRSPKELEVELQLLVNKVTKAIEDLKFNTCVAFLMEFSHKLLEFEDKISKKVWCNFLIVLNPFAPHLAEELWRALGNKKSIQLAPWPEIKEVAGQKTVKMAVQINGKVRDTIEINAEATQEQAVAKALESKKIQNYIAKADEAEKVIYVPGRILNLVVNP